MSMGKTLMIGVVHGTASDDTGGKMAAITPSFYIWDLLNKTQNRHITTTTHSVYIASGHGVLARFLLLGNFSNGDNDSGQNSQTQETRTMLVLSVKDF